jgi:drug/metabolite transporter (DMT)-like permease
MKPAHFLVLMLMNVFWAGTYSAFKALSSSLDAGQIVTLRYTLSAVVMGLLWPLLPGRSPRGWDLARTAVMGLLVFAVSPRCQVFGVLLGKAGDSAVVIALEPLVTALAAAWFLREHVPARRWVGFAVGVSGVALLNGIWRMEMNWTGLAANLIFLASFFCESAYSVMGKPLLERAGMFKVVALALGCGTLANLILDGPGTVARLPDLSAANWWTVAFLVLLCTLLGYCVWFVVIRETDISLAAMTILAQPVLGIGIAVVTIGEKPHWGQFWGSSAVVVGLVIGLWSGGRTSPVAIAPAPKAPGSSLEPSPGHKSFSDG